MPVTEGTCKRCHRDQQHIYPSTGFCYRCSERRQQEQLMAQEIYIRAIVAYIAESGFSPETGILETMDRTAIDAAEFFYGSTRRGP